MAHLPIWINKMDHLLLMLHEKKAWILTINPRFSFFRLKLAGRLKLQGSRLISSGEKKIIFNISQGQET
jgi:hypothetical protein